MTPGAPNSLSSRNAPLSVGFVLLQRFILLPFAAFVDCLRLSADEGDRSRQLRCHWTFMTSAGQEAVSSCGAAISPCCSTRPGWALIPSYSRWSSARWAIVWCIAPSRCRTALGGSDQHGGAGGAGGHLASQPGAPLSRDPRRWPQKFSRDLRLRYGLWLLHYTGKSITGIGERCGFADTAHFSCHFRSTFGVTPLEMRKRAGEPGSDRVDPLFLYVEGRPAL